MVAHSEELKYMFDILAFQVKFHLEGGFRSGKSNKKLLGSVYLGLCLVFDSDNVRLQI